MAMQRLPSRFPFACGLLLAEAAAVLAANDPEARFRGAPACDLAVANVKWGAATKHYSYVTFDLSWPFSWRAKWTEPAEKNVTGKPLEVENWDAAWVFVKFLPKKDSKESIERNHWQHATLSTDPAHHVMPAGATDTVGLTDDGKRGLGVFIYRDAIGHGANDFRGVKLRWLHGRDKVDPAKAAVKVHALAMVYVPEGAFKVGAGIAVPIDRFPDGPTRPIVGGPLPGKDPEWPAGCFGAFTDGAWRGGEPTIPFLVDAEWSGPVAEGSRARRIGPRPGLLWGNMVFDYHNRALTHGWGSMEPVGDGYPPATLHNDYPTGFRAFYCMKYYVTQGQYAAFLNSLPPDVAAARAFVSGDGRAPNKDSSAEGWGLDTLEKREVNVGAGYRPHIIEEWDGHTITSSGDPIPRVPIATAPDRKPGLSQDAAEDPLFDSFLKDVANEKGKGKDKPKAIPVYTALVPERTCNFLGWADGFAFAVWAGLRPMTELEFEKACRGPRHPVPSETVTGPGTREAPIDRARQAAAATYCGIRYDHTPCHGAYGMGGEQVVMVGTTMARSFRGSHGDGTTPPGTPGAPVRRAGIRYDVTGFNTAPADWPQGIKGGKEGVGARGRRLSSRGYGVGIPPVRLGETCWRGVRSVAAGHPPMRTEPRSSPGVAPSPPIPPVPLPRAEADGSTGADTIQVVNVKWEAGTEDYSTIMFDLAWENSWRAAWTEPADKNVTGKPLKVESWDAAWVFAKFRKPGVDGSSHATLAADAGEHKVPAGAALDVGLNDDGDRGLGVFIYRDAAGSGPVAFRNVKLRWLHGVDQADPSKVELAVHAIAMVYVAEGPSKSRSLLRQPIDPSTKKVVTPRHPLTLIATADATKPGGYYGAAGANVPEHAAWPNGYRAFYCMKRPISQGQFAAFLNSMKGVSYNARLYQLMPMETSRPHSDKLHYARFYGLCGYTITTDAAGKYRADAPDRPCNFLSWPDIQSYSAWAALRPPTALEYEKACRGPRDFVGEQDAWAEGACAPAEGLPAPAATPRASYWGIRGLSLSGCVHEWPGTIGNGMARMALDFKGTHGNGTPESPADWPLSTAFGEWFYMSWESGGGTIGFRNIGIWVNPFEMGRVRDEWMAIDADRTGRYGARAVRTAPFKEDPNSPLQVDRLPDLRGHGIGIFYLSGRFRNDSDKLLKLELAAGLPDACFPEGISSREFTAEPKAVTQFRILTALTPRTAADAVRKDGRLPVRVRSSGGGVLAERAVRLMLADPTGAKLPAIGSLDGGDVTLRLANATDRRLAVAIELTPPPGVKLSETSRRVEVAAGAETRASFHVPRQAFGSDRLCRMPYRVAVADGAPQSGETTADLRVASRWWITRRIQTGPKLDIEGGPSMPGPGERDGDLNIDDIVSAAGDVFKNNAPPKGWEAAVYGTSLPFGSLGPLPSSGSSVLAATRVLAPGDREVVINVKHQQRPRQNARFVVLVWFNDKVVYDSRTSEKEKPKPFRLREAGNTMVVGCRSGEDVPATPGDVFLQFHDAKDGEEVDGLMFDIDQR